MTLLSEGQLAEICEWNHPGDDIKKSTLSIWGEISPVTCHRVSQFGDELRGPRRPDRGVG